MKSLKHLPIDRWPAADRAALQAAFVVGDIFDDDGGPGAHLSPGSRRSITFAYRRWLGFLSAAHPEVFAEMPGNRISPDLVRDFITYLSAAVSSNTVAITITHLYYAARLIAPGDDWLWLRSVKSRLTAQTRPTDRFDRLVAPWRVLDHGIELMDMAFTLPQSGRHERDIQFRDGLLLALLGVWQIRRRSLTALTVSRHVERIGEHIQLLLYPEDTKSRRAESFLVPEILVPYFARYLDQIRPRLLGPGRTDAFWVSCRGTALCGQQLYSIVHRRTYSAFGRAMALHDFRRAAHTYLAMEAPELIGLIPGVLQHASPDVGDQHYNLARSTMASRRYAVHVSKVRERLRPAWRRQ